MHDFELNKELILSKSFQDLSIHSFSKAMRYVKNLPYGRNANREDFSLVLTEQKGTCSSKHALLKSLADENQHFEVKLMLGIFKMNGINTPKIKTVLEMHQLKYIPEAHNYLKIEGEIFDCTTANSSDIHFKNDLINEIEIQPEDVIQRKIEIHQEFLKNWCKINDLDFEEIWKIREICIIKLSSK